MTSYILHHAKCYCVFVRMHITTYNVPLGQKV